MIKEEYQITFNVPAFIGDAEQKSVWRTPPFKALIQHWWRIAVAKEHDYDWRKIRKAEGQLFGHAWLKDQQGQDWAMRSRVRMRLKKTCEGQLTTWKEKDLKVEHKEVKFPVGAYLYLGYGPLAYQKGSKAPVLKMGPAIKEKEQNQLILIYPRQEKETFQQVMQLIHWFGTLGGRSRNGWGSIEVVSSNKDKLLSASLLNGEADLTAYQKPLKDCLTQEWPHAIGTDEQGLLMWLTPERDNWQSVIKDLAKTKIKFRTDLPFPGAKPGEFEKRHLLAYPVTHHKVSSWGNNARLANQLRFKVARTGNKYFGLIVHLPCALPNEMSQQLKKAPSMQQQFDIWQTVHHSIDNQHDLPIKRITK